MTEFNFLTTHVGSVPHLNAGDLTKKLTTLLDVPAWPQMSRRSFRENMYVQYSSKLPALQEDMQKEKVYFQTSDDITEALETFFTPVITDDVEAFALNPDYAVGFFAMLDRLKETKGEWAKGQVTAIWTKCSIQSMTRAGSRESIAAPTLTGAFFSRQRLIF